MCGLFVCMNKDLKNQDIKNIISNYISKRGISSHCAYTPEYTLLSSRLPFTTVKIENRFNFDKIDGIFTGEIFNWKELNNNKEINSDSDLFFECVNNSLRKNIAFDCFHKFDGFWGSAFIYEKELYGITDFLGIKPIYYRTDIKALCSDPYPLSLLDPKPRYSDKFFGDILKFGYSPSHETPWDNIKRIPPGCYYHEGAINNYWDWDKIPLKQNLLLLLENSIDRRLITHYPSALSLSGGLDSTIIYNIIALKKIKIETYFLRMDNNEKDLKIALQLDPHLKVIDKVLDGHHWAIAMQQSPVDLGSVIPQYSIAYNLKKNNIKTLITGDGADELFGGYKRARTYDSQQSDIFTELPNYHLPRLDTLNMRNLVEYRSPFLSPQIIKYALCLPYDKRKDKNHLKNTFENFIPLSVLENPKNPLRSKDFKNNLRNNTLENIERFKKIFDNM